MSPLLLMWPLHLGPGKAHEQSVFLQPGVGPRCPSAAMGTLTAQEEAGMWWCRGVVQGLRIASLDPVPSPSGLSVMESKLPSASIGCAVM